MNSVCAGLHSEQISESSCVNSIILIKKLLESLRKCNLVQMVIQTVGGLLTYDLIFFDEAIQVRLSRFKRSFWVCEWQFID